MIPYFGILTGVIAGIVAARIVQRRDRKVAPMRTDSEQNEPASPDGQ